MATKYCPKCRGWKEFGPNKARPNGLQTWCKECMKEHRRSKRQEKSIYNAQYRGKNSISIKVRDRKWRAENKGHLRRMYDAYFQTPRGRAAKLLGEIRRRCKHSGMPCTIIADDLLSALTAGVCQATGMQLDFATISGPFIPSVDRIDHQQGYVPENVRVVILMFNLARRNWRDEDVLSMAHALVA